jgi:hypothetical protein
VSELTHETNFLPNFGGDPEVALHMTVRNKNAEITLAIGTGWNDPSKTFRGQFLEVHSTEPMWEDHTPMDATECPRGWSECYVDIRDGLGYEGAEMLRTKGSGAVWMWLDELWHNKFGGAQ